MVHLQLVCQTCKHPFELQAASTLKDEEKNCPECGSLSVRQTFRSYVRNGPLIDPEWAKERASCRSYG